MAIQRNWEFDAFDTFNWCIIIHLHICYTDVVMCIVQITFVENELEILWY